MPYLGSTGTQIEEVGLLMIVISNASVGNLHWQNMKSEMLLSEYQMMQPALGLLMKATNVFIIMRTRTDVSGSNIVVQVCCTVLPTALTQHTPQPNTDFL